MLQRAPAQGASGLVDDRAEGGHGLVERARHAGLLCPLPGKKESGCERAAGCLAIERRGAKEGGGSLRRRSGDDSPAVTERPTAGQ